MGLTRVSITGADDHVSFAELKRLNKAYPFVEWAILFYPGRAGEARNPSEPWRHEFYHECLSATKAAHVCASGIEQLARFPLLWTELEQFDRVQLNFKRKYLDDTVLSMLRDVVLQDPHRSYITQENPFNEGITDLMKNVPHHEILFDSSLGKGLSPAKWPTPVPGRLCGYAGGLGPDNLAEALPKIAEAAGARNFWIDMESGVRTDNELDLAKVEAVLEIAAPWVQRSHARSKVR